MNEALGFGSASLRFTDPGPRLSLSSTRVLSGCMSGPELSSLSLVDHPSGEGTRALATGAPGLGPAQVKLSLLGLLGHEEERQSTPARRPSVVLGLSDGLSDNLSESVWTGAAAAGVGASLAPGKRWKYDRLGCGCDCEWASSPSHGMDIGALGLPASEESLSLRG